MNKKNIIKTSVMSIIIILILSLTYVNRPVTKQKSQAYLVTGLSKEKVNGFQRELQRVSTEHEYIDKGNEYLKEGQIQKAIEQFNTVLKRGEKTSALDFARDGLVNAYEKARDYKTAADLLEKIIATFVLPKGDKWRTAEDERLLYLQFANDGNYDLAIEHAQKALEADAKLPNRPNGANPQYYERLNDLKAAKDYILSLKRKNKLFPPKI